MLSLRFHYFTVFIRTHGRMDFAYILFKFLIVIIFSFLNTKENDVILITVYAVGCFLLFDKVLIYFLINLLFKYY